MGKNIATSLTSVVFLVIAISGLMMFFHLFSMQVKELHEILGVVFVIAALFHIFFNWGSMQRYFTKKTFLGAFALTAIVSGVFVVNNLSGVDSKGIILRKVLDAPLQSSLSILGVERDVALKRLQANGIKLEEGKNITEIAKANQTNPFRIVGILTEE